MSRAAIIAWAAAGCLVVAAVAVWLLRPGSIPPAPKPVAAASTSVPPVVQTSSTPVPSAPASPSQTVSTAVGSPWSVVSEYYGDVESGDYPAAWQLLGFDPNGETYAQFVTGYACTGGQSVTETSSSGDQVSFDLSADDVCAGAEQTYTATDTVVNGKITGASITQLSGPGAS